MAGMVRISCGLLVLPRPGDGVLRDPPLRGTARRLAALQVPDQREGCLHLVNKVVTRDASKLAKGQIYYTPWCDERGKTVDDGTLWNFGDGSFRMTSAEPNLKWLQDAGMGLDAEVTDVSEDIGALALQGPSSRAILLEAADGAVQKLKYFRFVQTKFDGIPVQISRTGHTGDLGYEVWVERERAEAL